MDDTDLPRQLNLMLVDSLVASGHIESPAVRVAFTRVLRHHLLPGTNVADAYADRTIILKRATTGDPLPEGRTLSSSTMPGLLARILEQPAFRPGMRVLQIGTGSGYLAALLAELVGPTGRVVSVEIDPQVSARARSNLERCGYAHVECVAADGFYGHPARAPYDRIVATASCFDVPAPWIEQLAHDGTITLPLSLTQRASCYPMVSLQKRSPGLQGGVVAGLALVGFVPLYGPAVAHPVLFEPAISDIEAGIGQRLFGVTPDPTREGGLRLSAQLEISDAVLSDWPNHQKWDRVAIASRAVQLWSEAGRPRLSSFVIGLHAHASEDGQPCWSYQEHGRALAVWIRSER
jgi:protein-L-isoaspartate(D-aspartate) O-methyltransferase